ncbi:MAG: T9SS type A sorting domain-containing protein [Bacteroidota bacterium]
MPAKYLLMLLFCLCTAIVPVKAQVPDSTFSDADGLVNAMAADDSTLYIGGSFTHIGRHIGSGVAIDPNTLNIPDNFPKITGEIWSVISDNAGGWYVCGKLIHIGNTPLNSGLIHLKPDLKLDTAFKVYLSDSVYIYQIELRGNVLYVAGSFTKIGGKQRQGLAALDAATGNATGWNPKAGGYVTSMATGDNLMYVAVRDYDTLVTTTRVIAIELNTAAITNWHAEVSGPLGNNVGQITVRGNSVIISGYFRVINGVARHNIAVLNAATNEVTAWVPELDIYYAGPMALQGNTLYVAGSFTPSAKTRLLVAAFNFETGELTDWNPFDIAFRNDENYEIRSIIAENGLIYLAGKFGQVGYLRTVNFAVVDSVTGQAVNKPFVMSTAGIGTMAKVAGRSGKVYLAGSFNMLGGTERKGLAAFDIKTKALKDWNPGAYYDFTPAVMSLELKNNQVYASANYLDEMWRHNGIVLRIDKITGERKGPDPANIKGDLDMAKIANDKIYIVGEFNSVNGTLRNGMAAVNINSGALLPWSPACSEYAVFNAIETDKHGKLYVGGDFRILGEIWQYNLAVFDSAEGRLTACNFSPFDQVNAIVAVEDTIYVGGGFYNFSNELRNGFAAVNAITGEVNNIDLRFIKDVQSIASSAGSGLYVKGYFIEEEQPGKPYTMGAVNVANACAVKWGNSLFDHLSRMVMKEADGNLFYGRNRQTHTYRRETDYRNIRGTSERYLGVLKSPDFNNTFPPYVQPEALPWPNPAGDVLYFNTEKTNTLPEFYNIQGSRITVNITRNSDSFIDRFTADMSGLAQGMYLIRYNGRTYKIVKK